MASPENHMSGDRVDVLSVIKAMDSALDDANTGPPGAICVIALKDLPRITDKRATT